MNRFIHGPGSRRVGCGASRSPPLVQETDDALRDHRLARCSLFAAAPAAAFDLTGHWEGSWTCSGFDAGHKTKDSNREATIAITDFGNGVLAVRLDNDPWLGIAIYDASNTDRGEIALMHCGSDANLESGGYTEMARFRVSTSGERGSLSGISLYSASSLHIATCQYRLTRVDTVNPGLGYSCS